MSDSPKTADLRGPVKSISVHLAIDPDRLPAMVSAALSVAASAVISVTGGAAEIEKAMKMISTSDRDVVSALLTVRGK